MNIRKALIGIPVLLLSAQVLADVTFYEGEDFRGRAFTTNRGVADFDRSGFNDRASSVIVDGGQWEVCDDPGYRGRCVILRDGSYESLRRMGFDNRLSSVRKVSGSARSDVSMPEPLADDGYNYYEYRRRPNERLYEARVTSVRAVMGDPEQRCWVEREQVERSSNGNNNNKVAGGVIGGIIGGILGHEISGGKDVATAGGAIAGAAVGTQAGRSRGGGDDYSRDVRRCESVASETPAYWDVRYTYRNVEHRAQMSAAPGRTIAVNSRGEPRQP
jgi:uncharacterized protein YcfJ